MKQVPVEVYSRVVGYFRPVHQWNAGKREEFKERVEFSVSSIMQSMDRTHEQKQGETL